VQQPVRFGRGAGHRRPQETAFFAELFRMFDVIERLKQEWTDKYVVVDRSVPELARFGEATGQVRTVNMNGRCLVEFDQFNNIAWYDIDPSYLTAVPKPEPKPVAAKKSAPKAAGKSAAKPAGKSAAGPAGKAGRPSTADILAAARGKAASTEAKSAPEAKPAAAKKSAGRPSTADILAMARGKAAPPPAETEPTPEPTPEPTEPATDATPAEATEEPAAPAPKPDKPAADGPLPTTTAEKIAWCREHDAG